VHHREQRNEKSVSQTLLICFFLAIVQPAPIPVLVVDPLAHDIEALSSINSKLDPAPIPPLVPVARVSVAEEETIDRDADQRDRGASYRDETEMTSPQRRSVSSSARPLPVVTGAAIRK
jgi:hypothetical protein